MNTPTISNAIEKRFKQNTVADRAKAKPKTKKKNADTNAKWAFYEQPNPSDNVNKFRFVVDCHAHATVYII